MAFLLDTNVVSETIRPRPQQSVIDWIEAQTPTDLFLAAQTMGELMRGARKTKETARRKQFERWIEQDLARQFEAQILPFDGTAAAVWGRLMGDGDRTGRTPAAADAQIAAVAIQHELILVTRNEKDFVHFDMQLLNPWRLNEPNE